jgi:GMP synthase (glutamine-hydrolysing)
MPMKKVPLLLIDCVEGPPAESALSSVEGWFRERMNEGVPLWMVGASADELKECVENADAILVSGSPRDAFADDAFTDRLVDILKEVLGGNKPVLGVCYGHQVLARAAGGRVMRNPKGWELGDCEIRLTDAGKQSELLGDMPVSFSAKQSHQDIVAETPKGARLLASNDHAECQAIEYRKNAYGVQFHPEFTSDIVRHLWRERRVKLRDTLNFDVDARLDGMQETPVATRALTNFIKSLNVHEYR